MARALGVVALSLVALAALLVGSALTVLRTGWGGDLVKRLAVPRVNAAIAGSVQLDHFVFGGDHLTLKNVVLRDPEGGVVVRVREIDVAFSPLGLWRKRIRIPSVTVTEPSAFLRQDPAGLNLTRALSARDPVPGPAAGAKPKDSDTSSSLTVDVAYLRLTEGAVEFRAVADGETREVVRLSALTIGGGIHYDAGPLAFTASLQVDAMMQAPLPARFELALTGHGRGEQQEIEVRASLGDTALAVQGKTDSATRGTLRLSRLHVTPELVRALAPNVHLVNPIDVTTAIARDAATYTFSTRITTAEAGDLTARGTVDLDAGRVRPFAVTATHVDLGGIVEGLPRSNLSLTAEGEGTGRDLETMSGTVTLAMPAGRLDGASVGPITLRAKAMVGQYEIEELHAAFPGFTLVVHGPVGPSLLALDIAVDAPNLGLTSRALSSFGGLAAPHFTGRGRLDLSLTGTTISPTIRLDARFPLLAVGDNRVTGMKLKLRIPDARAPRTAEAELHLAEARIGARILRHLDVGIRSRARRTDVDVELGGPTPLSIAAGGTWGRDMHSFSLDQFRLRYPEATWTLATRAALSWQPDHLAVTGVDLHAGRQRLRLSVDERGSRLRAKIALEQFELGRLPRIALPPKLVVGGRLDLDGQLEADLRGGRAPVVRVILNLADGRVGGYSDLALAVDGQYRNGRVAGRLNARGLGSGVNARFDLPTDWPPTDARGPLSLDLTVAESDLTTVLAAADLPPRIAGRVAGVIHLGGTAREPELRIDTTAHGLVVDGQVLGDVTLKVSGDERDPIVARLEVGPSAQAGATREATAGARDRPLLGAGTLVLRTDFALGSLGRALPTVTALMRTHFDVSGTLEGLPLPALARLAHSTALSGGTASLRLSVSGTAEAPTGALNVSLSGATGPRFPPTDARVDAAFGQQDTRLALRVLRKGRELLSVSGILGLASRRLTDLEAVATAPLTLTAAVGPLHVSRQGIPGSPESAGSPLLSTDLLATVSVDGTLGRPTLTVHGDLREGRLGTKPIGEARVLMTYKDRLAAVDVRVRSPVKGELRLTSRSKIDLGFPHVLKGLDLKGLGLDVRLTAQNFDLGLLSGVTNAVGRVAGELSASVTAQGTVGAPRVRGQMEWTDGALTLVGLGDYAKIHLKAHGDETALWLEPLEAR